MASLYITEYGGISFGAGGAQVVEEPALAIQKLTIGATAISSAAFNAGTQVVRLHTDAICSRRFNTAADTTNGTTTAATAASTRMSVEQTEYIGVNPGMSVSVITNT